MKSIYNKIYKAINEGIHKALLIDPDQNDVSINYSYHKIDNKLGGQKYFNDIVKNFLDNPSKENYQLIIKNSYDCIYQYKPKSYNEIKKIIKLLLDKPCYIISLEKLDLHWLDFSDFISFILKDGTEQMFDKYIDKENIKFIKFKNSRCKHDIILHKNILKDERIWCNININKNDFNDLTCKTNNHDVLKDYNGYENTYNNVNIKSDEYTYYPAFGYCINIKNNYPDLNLLNYKAYLPAIGEIKFLLDNVKFLNYILQIIGCSSFNIDTHWWMSSTEFNYENVWHLKYDGSVHYNIKNSYYAYNIFPLFKNI